MKLKHLPVCAVMILTLSCLAACGSKENDSDKQPASENKVTTVSPEKDETKEKPSEKETDDKVTYKVKVVDDKGNAIPNAMVQICSDSCVPGKTDENGVAEFNVKEAEYKAKFMSLPAGYTYLEDEDSEEVEFHFDEGKTELTITLKAQ